MIVEMLKLKLLGVTSEKEKLLNLFFDCGMVEITKSTEIVNTEVLQSENKLQDIHLKKSVVEEKINLLMALIKQDEKKIEVSLKDFKNIDIKKIEEEIRKIEEVEENLKETEKLKKELLSKRQKLLPFINLEESFNVFKPTKYVNILLGTLPQKNHAILKDFLQNYPLSTFEEVKNSDIIKIYSHKKESGQVLSFLNELGFVKCNFDYNKPPKTILKNIDTNLKKLELKSEVENSKLKDFSYILDDLKLYYDYLNFLFAKAFSDSLIRQTAKTYYMECYLKKEEEEALEKLLSTSNLVLEYEFVKPLSSDNPPVITKNNFLVRPFEFVTNTYSRPNYKELDPNGFIMFFFSLFFGFIMADMGYGITYFVLGLILGNNKKLSKNTRNLFLILAFSGVVAFIFGIMFGTFFGLDNTKIPFLFPPLLPNPIANVNTFLIASLMAGSVQIMVSITLKGILLVRRKKILDAIFSSFVWLGFFVGIYLVVFQFLGITQNTLIAGLIISSVCVLVSSIGNLVIKSGFEKLSKSVGSIYSVINIFSDILSYARVFGLMLSGAIIASIISDLALPFLSKIYLAPLGLIIFIFGHSFNLAMGGLSAYIHTSRLQYIEFFSRFYEGEGEEFTPFARNFKYIDLH